MSKWISVKDRLPEKWSEILIYIPNFRGSKDFINVTIYVNKEGLFGATHWRSLPEKP
jgi:hypothetical protein